MVPSSYPQASRPGPGSPLAKTFSIKDLSIKASQGPEVREGCSEVYMSVKNTPCWVPEIMQSVLSSFDHAVPRCHKYRLTAKGPNLLNPKPETLNSSSNLKSTTPATRKRPETPQAVSKINLGFGFTGINDYGLPGDVSV